MTRGRGARLLSCVLHEEERVHVTVHGRDAEGWMSRALPGLDDDLAIPSAGCDGPVRTGPPDTLETGTRFGLHAGGLSRPGRVARPASAESRMPHPTVIDAPARPRRDWPGLFLRAVLSLFLGLPLGGVLFALTGLGIALVNDDPLLQHPWLVAFRTVAAAVGYVFLGGFAWTPEGGYRSLHAWYAAGVVLAFLLMSRPWQRWTRRTQPEAWPRKA